MPETVISFPVDDGPFKAFLDLYNKFQDAIKDLPKEWDKVNDSIGKSTVSLDKVIEGLNGQNEALEKIQGLHERIAKVGEEHEKREGQGQRDKEHLQAQKEISLHAETQAKHWREMANHAGTFALRIKDATISILKWTSITGIVGGLLGGGGLFGISRLAESAASTRTSSMGVGVSVGQQRAFGINYGEYLGGDAGANSFLSNINEMRTNISKSSPLSNLGITREMMQGKNAADVGLMVLDRIREFARKRIGKDGQYGSTYTSEYEALGYGNIMSSEQSQLQGRISNEEHARTRKEFGQDYKNMGSGELGGWADLEKQLKRAGTLIESTFIKALAPLVPQLIDLSKAFEGLIRSLLTGDAGKRGIDLLTKGLEKLAGYMGDPQFAKDVNDFVTGVARMAGVLARFVGMFSGGSTSTETGVFRSDSAATAPLVMGPLTKHEAIVQDWNSGHERKVIGDMATGLKHDAGKAGKEIAKEVLNGMMHGLLFPGDEGGLGRFFPALPLGVNPSAPNGVPRPGPLFGPQPMSFPVPGSGALNGLLWNASYGGGAGAWGGSGGAGGTNSLLHQAAFNGSVPWGAGGSVAFADIEKRHGLASGTLAAFMQNESGGRLGAVSKAGAQGPFQFMPGTWKDYGHGSPFNLADSSEAAGSYIEHLLSVFHGNMEQATAGYNAGEERVNQALSKAAKQGGDWRTFLPMETQGYLHKFGYGASQTMAGRSMGGGNTRFAININNATGGSAVFAARQLA